MAYILCLETTTTNCSVALFQDNKLCSLQEDMGARYSHAELLHTYIAKAVKACGITLKQLDAVTVSKGPGSYTGLRIGVSSAKGLCFAHDIPLIATETLKTLALQAKNNVENSFTIPLLDARRMEVYSAVYNKDMEQIRSTEAEILDENSFKDFLKQSECTFIGNGVSKFAEICSNPKASFLEDKLPSAREMGVIAQQKYQQKDFENLAYFEPYYLKDFQTTAPKKS